MIYADTTTEPHTTAAPSARGTCPGCMSEVIAKCGAIRVWHWAHANSEDCGHRYPKGRSDEPQMAHHTGRIPTTTKTSTHEERAEEYGLHRIGDERCPRLLVGKRHMEEKCWCAVRLNDHSAMYTRHGRHVVIWEPYDGYALELTEVFEAARADGLHVAVTGMSPWNPGRTFALWFEAAA